MSSAAAMHFNDAFADLVDSGALLWVPLDVVGLREGIQAWFESTHMGFAMSAVYAAGIFTFLAVPMLFAGLFNSCRPVAGFALTASLTLIIILFTLGGAAKELFAIYYLAYFPLLAVPYGIGWLLRLVVAKIRS